MSALRIDVSDLLVRAGARRPLQLTVPPENLVVGAIRVDAPLDLDLVLERVQEGIVVRGTIRARFEAECGVCLGEVAAEVDVAVSELYEDDAVEGDTYPLLGHVIDLEQLVRDAVLLELPLAPTCASTGGAACTPEPVDYEFDDDADASVDPRWAVLSELEL